MAPTKERVEAYVRRLPTFSARDTISWEVFLAEQGDKAPVHLDNGDSEAQFTKRLGRALQEKYRKKIAQRQQLTPHEVMLAADAIDYQGRTPEAHEFILDILFHYWEHYELLL